MPEFQWNPRTFLELMHEEIPGYVRSSVPEQIVWLEEAGFEVEARYIRGDLAVFVATKRRGPP